MRARHGNITKHSFLGSFILQSYRKTPYVCGRLLGMDSEMFWDILKFPNCNWLYLTPESGKAFESGKAN